MYPNNQIGFAISTRQQKAPIHTVIPAARLNKKAEGKAKGENAADNAKGQD